MTSPRGERWWGALRALEKVGQQASVEAMMDDRYDGIPATVFRQDHHERKAGPSINGFMILPSGEEIAGTGRAARRGAGHDRALRRHRRRRFLPPVGDGERAA